MLFNSKPDVMALVAQHKQTSCHRSALQNWSGRHQVHIPLGADAKGMLGAVLSHACGRGRAKAEAEVEQLANLHSSKSVSGPSSSWGLQAQSTALDNSTSSRKIAGAVFPPIFKVLYVFLLAMRWLNCQFQGPKPQQFAACLRMQCVLWAAFHTL